MHLKAGGVGLVGIFRRAYAVSAMAGTTAPVLRKDRMRENPSASGMRISDINTSGGSVSISRLASLAVATASTYAPASSRVALTISLVSS